jgi:DNA repair photolyase
VPSDKRVLVDCVQQYCYCRERKYCPFDDLDDFGCVVQVKENAPDLLRRALSRVPVDIVATGDYQPAERKFGLSRQMLEVCLDLGFSVSVLERSPLVLRDLDLLKEINEQARAVMMRSIIYTPDSRHRAPETDGEPGAAAGEAFRGYGAVCPRWYPDRDVHDADPARSV